MTAIARTVTVIKGISYFIPFHDILLKSRSKFIQFVLFTFTYNNNNTVTELENGMER